MRTGVPSATGEGARRSLSTAGTPVASEPSPLTRVGTGAELDQRKRKGIDETPSQGHTTDTQINVKEP